MTIWVALLYHRLGICLVLVGTDKIFQNCNALYTSSNLWESSFLHVFFLLTLFNISHSGGIREVDCCGFNLYFPNDWWCWIPFHMLFGHLGIIFVQGAGLGWGPPCTCSMVWISHWHPVWGPAVLLTGLSRCGATGEEKGMEHESCQWSNINNGVIFFIIMSLRSVVVKR